MAITGFLARFGLAVALAVAAPIAVVPITPAVAQFGADVTLTTDSVEAFIRSYAEVKGAADTLGKKYGVADGGGSIADAWGAWMTATSAWGELNGIVSSYGFPDFQTWLQTTISVATAYAFAKQGPAMDAGMAAAIAQIQNNPSIPETQKKLLIDQMQASLGVIATMRPPQENIDAVTPYLAEIDAVFN